MKQVSEMPTSGQFVMIWEFHGAVWSSTVKIEDGIEHIYNEDPYNQLKDERLLNSIIPNKVLLKLPLPYWL